MAMSATGSDLTQSRIIVRNLSQQVTADDLKLLFQKLRVLVNEVYLPPVQQEFGLRRDFAIVRIACEPSLVHKAVKTFNGSMWKGSKISVEMARQPYFRERLEQEWREEQNAQNLAAQNHAMSDGADADDADAIVEPIIPYTARPLAFRKRKLVQIGSRKKKAPASAAAFVLGGRLDLCKTKMIVQAEPALAFDFTGSGGAGVGGVGEELEAAMATAAAMKRVKRNGAVPCGVKTVFDPTLLRTALGRHQQQQQLFPADVPAEEEGEADTAAQAPLEEVAVAGSETDADAVMCVSVLDAPPSQPQEEGSRSADGRIAAQMPQRAPPSPDAAALDRPAGGGVRRGFGTLVSSTKSSKQQQPTGLPSSSASIDVDCCVERDAADEEAVLRRGKLRIKWDD